MAQRLNSTLEEARREIQHIDGFKYYAGMAAIIASADIKIINNKPLDEIVLQLKNRIESDYKSGIERRT